MDKHLPERADLERMTIRKAVGPEEYPRLVDIWRSAVAATHDFLSAVDRIEIEEVLASVYFPQVDLYLAQQGGAACGFIGVAERKLEMLFVDDAYRGGGVGGELLDFALRQCGVLEVDVNEQNVGALGFYLHKGFRVAGRSPFDEQGRPYPLLHLALAG